MAMPVAQLVYFFRWSWSWNLEVFESMKQGQNE
jgi:hypothetical protein